MKRRVFLKGGAALVGAAMMPSSLWAAKKQKEPLILHVPAEEALHEHTFMQWPVSKKVHTDPHFLKSLQKTIATIAKAIAKYEPVVMMCPRRHERKARKFLDHPDIYLIRIDTEDLWCRDSGPLIAKDQKGRHVVSHIQFNGWGKKQVHKKDGQIAKKAATHFSLKLVPAGLKGEAGGVEQDGHGLLMAHESSWVNENRNPGMTRDEIEEKLLKAYGAEKMIWAPGVKGEDITDYHIDSLARFTGKGRVLMNLPKKPDKDDPFHKAALETRDILKSAGLEVDIIPEPDPSWIDDPDFVASYVNYYVCNGAVIAPQFGDADTDQQAVRALKKHYPGREIIQLNVDPLGEIGGGIHCATQQMPA